MNIEISNRAAFNISSEQHHTKSNKDNFKYLKSTGHIQNWYILPIPYPNAHMYVI